MTCNISRRGCSLAQVYLSAELLINIPESEGMNVEREVKGKLQCFYVWKWFTNLDVIWMSWNTQTSMNTNTYRFSHNKFNMFQCLQPLRKTRPVKRVCPHSFLTLQESRWFLIKPLSQLDAPPASQPHEYTYPCNRSLSTHSVMTTHTSKTWDTVSAFCQHVCFFVFFFFDHNEKGWLSLQWDHTKKKNLKTLNQLVNRRTEDTRKSDLHDKWWTINLLHHTLSPLKKTLKLGKNQLFSYQLAQNDR